MAESKPDGQQQWWDERPKAARRRWLRPRNVILVTLLALLVWGGVFLYGVMYAEPVISVDYRPRLVEMVRQKQGMPEGAENGWAILRGLSDSSVRIYQEAKAEAEKEGIEPAFDYDYLYNPAYHIDDESRRDEYKSRALKYIGRLRRAGVFAELNRLRETPFGARVPKEERLLDYIVPEVGSARGFTRANLARMHLAHQRGDDEERFEAFDQCLAMAQLESRQGSLLEHLVGLAIFAAATNELKQEFIERPPSEAECDRVLTLLESRMLADSSAALEGERLLNYDVVQTMFSDTGNGNGRLLLTRLNDLQSGGDPTQRSSSFEWMDYKISNLLGLFAGDRRENIAMIDEYFDHATRQAAMTRHERLADPFDADAFAENVPRSYPVIGILIPAIGKAMRSHDQYEQGRVGLRLIIAIERYRARSGHYPVSLSDLAPTILSELPMDSYTGQAFGYRRFGAGEDPDGRGYLLYSFGLDGKDDGGKPVKGNWDALHLTKAAGTDYIINLPRPKPAPKPADADGDGTP